MEVPELVHKIYEVIQLEKSGREKYFSRLGASGIGKDCLRAVFYSWRGFSESNIDGRVHRLFETGFIQEERIVRDLQKAGVKVWALQSDGSQFKYEDESGHFVAKIDGIAKHVIPGNLEPLLLEIKTMGQKAFERLKKNGIQQDHNYQIHAGMWLLGLSFGLYVVINKNDEQYHIEIIDRDEEIIVDLQDRLQKLIMGGAAPPRLSDNQAHFSCSYCSHKGVCSGEVKPVKSCRSCAFVTPIGNGEWLCENLGISLNMEQQVSGCDLYCEYGK